jgi:hypothetical protein
LHSNQREHLYSTVRDTDCFAIRFPRSSNSLCEFTVGALAQMGERLICIQEVSGSIPLGSTIAKLQSNLAKEAAVDCKAINESRPTNQTTISIVPLSTVRSS